jgi:hypothetical protein
MLYNGVKCVWWYHQAVSGFERVGSAANNRARLATFYTEKLRGIIVFFSVYVFADVKRHKNDLH